MVRRKTRNIAIVGGGKVGSVLGKILTARGHHITAIVSRTLRSARLAGKFVGCRNVSTELGAIPPETDIVFIATPHDAIGDVARSLAAIEHLNFKRLAVCHASGIHDARVLDPLAERKATVFSFHPLQTFPRDFAPARIVPYARGIQYGVDGTPSGVRMARVLAAELGGKVIIIPPELRVFYHAACVVASNHLTTVLWVVEQMYRRIAGEGGKFYPVFRPIVEATIANVNRSSPAEALSGPIARGGKQTVEQHLESVRKFMPQLLPYFVEVSLETLRLAETKGSLDLGSVDAMERLIRSYSYHSQTRQDKP
jgi:predicted short-subunit dehydrogenase-like oxidoreductase (DUF2520 family)